MPRYSQIAVSARTEPYAELRILIPGSARSRSPGSLAKKRHSLQVGVVMGYRRFGGAWPETLAMRQQAYKLDQ
jgi:hypothetical protein